MHKDLINAPEVIIEYSTSFNWPVRKEFQSELIDEYMGSVFIGGDVYSLPEDYDIIGTENMYLFTIGGVGDGNYILLVDANSTEENPTVYLMDHDIEPDEELDEVGSLNELFKSLKEST